METHVPAHQDPGGIACYYETLKHTGELPIVGVNTYLDPQGLAHGAAQGGDPLAATTRRSLPSPRCRPSRSATRERSAAALAQLQRVAVEHGNIFEELFETVKICSLGRISGALYRVGGQYRRNM